MLGLGLAKGDGSREAPLPEAFADRLDQLDGHHVMAVRETGLSFLGELP
jgi:hypothetical protein